MHSQFSSFNFIVCVWLSNKSLFSKGVFSKKELHISGCTPPPPLLLKKKKSYSTQLSQMYLWCLILLYNSETSYTLPLPKKAK